MSGVFAYNVFFFSGLQTVTAGRVSLIIALNPIVISVCSSIFFRERLTPIKILGILLSVTGAMYVITYGDLTKIFEKSMGQGELFIFGAVVSWATYSLIGKVVLSNLSPLVSVGYSSLVGAIALMVPAVYRGFFNAFTTYTLEQWFSLFYLGFFGTVLGFLWYYQAINRVGPMKSSVFINFVPVSAIVLAYIILNEPITASLVIGALLVICGVILANFSYLLLKLFKRI